MHFARRFVAGEAHDRYVAVADVAEHALARGVADLPEAGVFAFELLVSISERAHDAVREVVPPVLTGRIAARHFEHRRRMRDDDTTDVRDLSRDDAGATLLEIETKPIELRDLGLQTRCFVFAACAARQNDLPRPCSVDSSSEHPLPES